MTRRLRIFLSAIVLVGGVLVTHAPAANAIGIYRTDGNDVQGALDLASVRLTEIKGGDRFTIRTLTAFTATQLNGSNGWVEVDIDVNADRNFEYWVAVFYNNGKLRAVQGHGDRGVRYVPVRRVDKRAVSFDLAHRYLGSVGSFDFATFSVWRASPCSKRKPCVDAIPNRYPLMRHDWTPPTIAWKSVPAYSTDATNTLSFPVTFVAKDNQYGSGLDHWTVQAMQTGGAWTTVKTGRLAKPTVTVTGAEGEVTFVRVIAYDRQKNKRISTIKNVTVPFDDRNAALVYSAAPTLVANADAFLGTTSEMAETTTLTYTLPDTMSLCVIGGPTATGTTASASLAVGGSVLDTMTETDATAPHSTVGCVNGFTSGGQDLVVTVTTAAPFVVDGIAILPA
jgi:hypothetical protein